ncbi:hypothetical protein SLEP1_g36116 [Rubroshorea leprosula]|uniref:Wall-associated receptor kinase galacturonan-binding domain-containing protein n=1 Tax=Rubroshorea leprosula TaxID=152421 RepID=A0AAV5KR00_9ROSI|nr:hypothetical protein SLEP1_g36116 [Rubroshorea leprosula]
MMIITRTSAFAFLQLLMIESAVGQALVKPGCKEHCGNVSIPYPFGIRADCYMHKEFEVSCGETSNPPTNLLTSIETEVLYFSLDHSIVNVKIPITSQQCSVRLNFLDFSGSPLMSYKGRMLLLPEGYVPALLDRVITDEDPSQLPYRYDHAFNCSQFNGTIANSSFFIILLPSVPYGCQGINLGFGVVCLPIELERATNDFNRNKILGQGGQGTVYKGMLAGGRIVAVKKSKILHKDKVKEFINEYIHDYNEDFPLTWERRLTIATEVAGVLSYLHSAASIPIYHRDVKSSNILMDGKESSAHEEITKVAKLAYQCLSLSGRKWPKMIEIAAELEQICLSQNYSNGQQNHEEVRYVNAGVTNRWDGTSNSTGSGLDPGVALSLDMES